MNIHFDVFDGESNYPRSKIQEVIDRLESKHLLAKDEEGSSVIDLTAYSLGIVVFSKPNGSLLYIARDIAAAIDRYRIYEFHRMIYVVASQQKLHFQQLFKILELLGFSNDCVHVNFGMVRGMNTRNGTAVFLEEILDQAKTENLQLMQKNPEKYAECVDPELTADQVGISAVVIQDLSAKRIKDYTFSWQRMLQSTGDTGVYLQYAHVRISGILRKVDLEVTDEIDYSLLVEPECHQLISWLSLYPSILQRAAIHYEPSLVVQFALKLTHLISSAVETLQVKRALTPELRSARLLLFWSAKQCLSNALRLLSLIPLERM